MAGEYDDYGITLHDPARNKYLAVPNDDDVLPHQGRAIHAQTSGVVRCILVDEEDDPDSEPVAVVAGFTYPMMVKKIYQTGTSAQVLVLY